jgi:Fe-S oxidoreductase
MALEEYRDDMKTCCRCSVCKWIHLERLKGYDFAKICPSIAKYNYRAYSGGGRIGLGMALLEGHLDYESPKLQEVIYNCQMCGGCDTSCKYMMDMEVLEPMNEIRAELVKRGNVPAQLQAACGALAKGGSMVVGASVSRNDWMKGLKVADKGDVLFHAGCRTAFDEGQWSVAQNTVKLMEKAGVSVAVSASEGCCGGRAFQMGFKDEAEAQAKKMAEGFKAAGVKTIVTDCAECYYAFAVLYDRFKVLDGIEVMHTSQYFAKLIADGKLTPSKPVNETVTYHDPCHLGRQADPWVHGDFKRIDDQFIIFEPEKEYRRGTYGVYDAPRELLKAIPGLKLIEMQRNEESGWCCGAGGGVAEYNPAYALETAQERVREIKSTGATTVVTGCPGCESLLGKAAGDVKVVDVVDLLAASVL